MGTDDEDKVFRDLITDDVQEGDFESRKIQKIGRIDVPDEFWEFIGLDIGDEVIVIAKGDRLVIAEKDLNKMEELV